MHKLRKFETPIGPAVRRVSATEVTKIHFEVWKSFQRLTPARHTHLTLPTT